MSNTKYGRLPDKLDEEIQWSILCVDLTGTYIIHKKENKDDLSL